MRNGEGNKVHILAKDVNHVINNNSIVCDVNARESF